MTSPNQQAVSESAADAWEPGPLRPRLADGAVHVWRADVTAVSDDLIEVLSPDEWERAERFLKAQDGVLWARAHGVLRVLLGRYLEANPVRLRFASGEHGKPVLIDDVAASTATRSKSGGSMPVHFNLSHSRELAVYAFSVTSPVGVDVEIACRPIDHLAVAGRALGPAEAERLELLEPAERECEFLRIWVRHEAEVKCRGTVLGGVAGARRSKPWIAELDVGPRSAAAVAIACAPPELQTWDWARAVDSVARRQRHARAVAQ